MGVLRHRKPHRSGNRNLDNPSRNCKMGFNQIPCGAAFRTATLTILTMIKKALVTCRLACAGLLLLAITSLTPVRVLALGSWTNIIAAPPTNQPVELMLLLSDGSVMAKEAHIDSGAWYRLWPDTNGSYITGHWTTMAPMKYTREFFASAVLQDGRVFVAGGEYGTGGSTAEVYDPTKDLWTEIPVPPGLLCTNCTGPLISDAESMILPDGKLLIAPVLPISYAATMIFDPVSNTLTNGPPCFVTQDEATWVKLPDDSIITIDPTTNATALNTSERFIPPTTNFSGGWVGDGQLPVAMYNSVAEIGGGLLLPDGRAFFIGGNGHTAYYTPSGSTLPGHWTQGPEMVSPTVGWDEPAALLVNGKVLMQTTLGPLMPTNLPQPRGYYEMDPNDNYPTGTITEAPEWGDSSGTSHMMLNLPDGNLLVSYGSNTLRVYLPDGNPIAAGKPTINSITPNGNGSFHLTGTKLNGISQGQSFGDDAQMNGNYPLVRLVAASGEITYGRTFNWSSTGVQTSNKVVSTEFTLPSSIAGSGPFKVQVVVNGFASDPVDFPQALPGQTITFSGNSSMGSSGYEIFGGSTVLVDDGSASGFLLRGPGGVINVVDAATAGTASIYVDGGMGNGGIPGFLRFSNNATAGAATIVDHPGVRGPNFKNATPNPIDGFSGETFFYDNSSAGTAHFSNEGEADDNESNGATGGLTTFADTSTADHGTFVNYSSAVNNGKGGVIQFLGSATAGLATFTNLNSPTGYAYSQGRTIFFSNSTAGLATFVNVGGASGSAPMGGTTEFRGNSTAASGTFINQGPTGGNVPGRGDTQFFDTATAGNGTFRNLPGVNGGGGTEFYGHSTAGDGTFLNDSTVFQSGQNGGEFLFKDDSAAGTGYFHTMGAPGGYVTFRNRASADHGYFLVDPNLYNARIVFTDQSTASNGTFEIGGNGYLQFQDSATAGNATILLRGTGSGAYGGIGSTLGSANVTVNGSEVDGSVGANMGFAYPATAGNATVTVNGASVTTFGATGGSASFDYSSSAGTATFIINGGTNGGPGGVVTFARGATADQAHVIVNPGGKLDVSGNAYYNGTSVGIVEGAGSVYLGFAALTAGGLNTDATISGVISDYGIPGYLGTLTKIGIGTLTLSGSNTYAGLTTINGGTLAIDGFIPGDVQVNGGTTLKGSGTIGGSVTVAPGGVVAPGHSPGTLTINSNYTQSAQSTLQIIVAGPAAANRSLLVVKGNATLNGTLLLVFSGYAPSPTETFPLIQANGTISSNNLSILIAGLKPGFQASCQVIGGQLVFNAQSSSQLRTASDPVQILPPKFTQSGFVVPVFALSGATYEFDTSTDLVSWTFISQTNGGNNLLEFRPVPTPGDFKRFYRVIQTATAP